MIKFVPYDKDWTVRFVELQRVLSDALRGIQVVSIEHVGSTSVPGLAAKPVIDIDVVVSGEDVVAASEALARIGFVPRGDLGVPDRYAFFAPKISFPRIRTLLSMGVSHYATTSQFETYCDPTRLCATSTAL